MSKARKDDQTETEVGTNRGRRRFLQAGGAGALAAAGGLPVTALADGQGEPHWDEGYDIVVVGGGAAGSSAAIKAHDLGNRTVVLEKGPVHGGTAAKSVGGIWVPNNRFLRAAGVRDDRTEAIRYMVRLSYPEDYDPQHPTFGAQQTGYDLIAAYYDQATVVLEELAEAGALRTSNEFAPGVLMPDYFSFLPENKVPAGRALVPIRDDGSVGNGAELMRQLKAALDKRRVPVRTRHRVQSLVRNAAGRIVGVAVTLRDGSVRRIGAAKGVIFGSGGFTHNKQMRLDFLKGPVFGGCAAPGSEGDFVRIGTAVGAQLGNMSNAWWTQISLEQALQNSSVPTGIWSTPGDSVIQVNARGERFFDEKFVYNERTQKQFEWDPKTASYPNLLSFMIYDQRTADEFGGYYMLPPKGGSADYVLRGETLEKLADVLSERLASVASHTGGFALQGDFAANLARTVKRFNGFARSGKDEDFQRGSTDIDQFFHFFGPTRPVNPMPDATMHPLADEGPYYAIILAAGTLDTKGGPKIDPGARILDGDNRPIPGLYGAGNCIASPTGPAYWAGGATLGPALTFGNLAARSAHQDAA